MDAGELKEPLLSLRNEELVFLKHCVKTNKRTVSAFLLIICLYYTDPYLCIRRKSRCNQSKLFTIANVLVTSNLLTSIICQWKK